MSKHGTASDKNILGARSQHRILKPELAHLPEQTIEQCFNEMSDCEERRRKESLQFVSPSVVDDI
jgi:hypothetical protein